MCVCVFTYSDCAGVHVFRDLSACVFAPVHTCKCVCGTRACLSMYVHYVHLSWCMYTQICALFYVRVWCVVCMTAWVTRRNSPASAKFFSCVVVWRGVVCV
eukprot:GDKI01007533.1.p1 GENE.GDKI01007533.1~~GDKI01007533.1.p1  ORF type:complete len:101 (-),score=21.30 GDKI01007533.1:141-443(-)